MLNTWETKLLVNKVLFVVNKWGNIKDPNSNVPDHDYGGLISSFVDAGLAEHDVVYYDDCAYNTGKPVDVHLQDKLNSGDYDAVIALLVHWMPTIPSAQTMASIAATKPIAYIWYDAVGEGERQLCESLNHTAALNVFMDTLQHPPNVDNAIQLWFPRDSRMYYADSKVERDIDVSWLGNVTNYGERGYYMSALKGTGANVWMPEHRLSNAECCDIWRRSKMSLNFSGGVDHTKKQFKTRIMEVTLCGAMLLESHNEEIKRWFRPNQDYIAFGGAADLISKIEYYKYHHDERESVAKSGCEKATKEYNSINYWQSVLERLR